MVSLEKLRAFCCNVGSHSSVGSTIMYFLLGLVHCACLRLVVTVPVTYNADPSGRVRGSTQRSLSSRHHASSVSLSRSLMSSTQRDNSIVHEVFDRLFAGIIVVLGNNCVSLCNFYWSLDQHHHVVLLLSNDVCISRERSLPFPNVKSAEGIWRSSELTLNLHFAKQAREFTVLVITRHMSVSAVTLCDTATDLLLGSWYFI